MRKNILSSFFAIYVIALAFGCKPKKVIVVTPPATTAPVAIDKKPENLKLLKSKDLPFNTLALRGKAKLEVNGDEHNVTMIIRIQRDQKIWVSVTALAGIEVARAVITPDSLLLRNNIQKTYIRKPFSYAHRFTNKQVNFAMLQAVFSGNSIPDLTVMSANLVQENGVWVLSGLQGDLAFSTVFNTLLKPEKTSLNDAKAGQAFKVEYGKYTTTNNALFPSTLKVNTQSGTKKINVDIEFTKIESNVQVDFPFSVPKSYELIN